MGINTIAFVTGGLGSGGLERVSANVANHYAEKGWNVRFLLLLDPVIFQKMNDNIDITTYTSSKKSKTKFGEIIPWLMFIRKNIKEYRPKVIIAMTFKIGALVKIATYGLNIKIIVREINDPKTRSWVSNFVTDFFVSKTDGIIFQTEWEKICHSRACQRIGSIIVNPVKIPKFDKSFASEKIISTMGRLLLKQKRQDILLEGFALFLESHPEYILHIYGDGPDEEKLRKLIKKLGIEKSVYLLGAKKNVHELIMSSEIFILSSFYEGLSNALLEAWLMGIPCISSDWNGVKEIITDGYDGLIYKKNEPKDLASKIAQLVDNPELCRVFSERAILNSYKYDFSTVIKKWENMIENDK